MQDRLVPIWDFVRHYQLAAVGGLVVLTFLLTGLLAPALAPKDPNQINIREALAPPGGQHVLGTDNQGRDLLSRILWGARVSLTISLSAVGAGAVAGVA